MSDKSTGTDRAWMWANHLVQQSRSWFSIIAYLVFIKTISHHHQSTIEQVDEMNH